MQKMIDDIKNVLGLFAIVPSTSTPDYVTLKNYDGVLAVVTVSNATTVTGSAITLKQATAVAGTGEKALGFDTMQSNIDLAASSVMAVTAVTSDTFTTDSTNSKLLKYLIDIPTSALDADNDFDCFRVGTGDSTAATVHVEYYLYHARYKPVLADNPIVD